MRGGLATGRGDAFPYWWCTQPEGHEDRVLYFL